MDNQLNQPEPDIEPVHTLPTPSEPVQPMTPPPAVVTPPTPQPAPNNKGKNAIIAVLAVLLLLALGAVAYLLMNDPKEAPLQSTNTNQPEQKEEKEEEVQPTRFTSKLWPDLAFDVPAGWTATEPADYAPSNSEGAKFVDGKILVKDDATTLALSLNTARNMGIVGPAPCYTKQNLHNITGDIYRFNEDDKLVIQSGYSSSSSKWEEMTTGQMTQYKPGNNYCHGWTHIGVYASTIKQPANQNDRVMYGYQNNEHIMAFLTAEATGRLTDDQIQDIDAIIKSLSKSTPIVDFR